MAQQITIPLDKPLVTHDGEIREVILREPTFDEYLDLGEPYTVAQTHDGTPFAVDNVETLRAYLRVCLVKPSNPDLLNQGGYRLAREVRKTIFGFFRDGGEDNENSKTSPKTSQPAISPTSEA
jgi:hypothetical protein